MTTIKQVKQLGQQIWLDNLSRSLVQSGELARFLADGVCGVTSNPTIFQKAFSGDALYIPEIEALKQQNKTAKEIYETLAIADVQAACDVCRAEYDSTGGKTGFVSLEVSPELSHDAERTIAEAQRHDKNPRHRRRLGSTHHPRRQRHQREPHPIIFA